MGICSSTSAAATAETSAPAPAPEPAPAPAPTPAPAPPATDKELLILFEALASDWSKHFSELGRGGNPAGFKAMFKQDHVVEMRQYRPDNVAGEGAATDMSIFFGPDEKKPEGAMKFENMVEGLVAKLQGEEYTHTDCHCYGVKLIGESLAHGIFEFKRYNKAGEPYDGGLVLVSAEYINGTYLFTEMWTWGTEEWVKKAPEPIQKVFSEARGVDESEPERRVRGFLKSKPYHAIEAGQDDVAQAS